MNILLTAFFLMVSVVRVEAAVSLCNGVVTGSGKKAECTYSTLSSFKRGVLRDIVMWWHKLGKPEDISIVFNNVPQLAFTSRVTLDELAYYVGSLPDASILSEEISDARLDFGDPAKPGFLMVVNEPRSILGQPTPMVAPLVAVLFWCCRRGRRLPAV